MIGWVFFSFSSVMGGTLTPELTQERNTDFAPILQDARLQRELLANAYVMDQHFNYADVMDGNTDVLLIGETHSDSIPEGDVNLILQNLVQGRTGITHVGSEFILSSEQPALDKFARGEINYAQLRKAISLDHRAFLAVIGKRYNLRVLGLDLPKARENVAWAMSPNGLNERNLAWLQIIKQARNKQPKSKFVIYGGADHTKKYSRVIKTMPQLLEANGFKTKTIEFVNDKDPLWKQIPVEKSYDVFFIIPNSLKKAVGADYVVYTNPQDLSKEDSAQLSRYIDKVDFKDPLQTDACVYDPESQVCKTHLRVRRKG